MEMGLEQNVGDADRGLRFLLGLILMYLAAFNPLPFSMFWRVVFSGLGVVMVVIGIIGY
ncbi:MAG TPA: DUF2892 domain-containing protein [Syntrophomonadaceae bacterium]|nr:DUF2892 domain-containing protein [Syntrophomonadaceae bacterium]